MYVTLNGNENYLHFIWVLVVSGFAETAGSRGVEADPYTKIFGHHWGGRPHPAEGGWGLNPANPPSSPGKSNTGFIADEYNL